MTDILLDPTKSFDIHVGLTTTYAEMFRSHMEHLGHEVFDAADGWEVWGEPIGTNGNDANTVHVVIRFPSVEDALLVAFNSSTKYRDILVRMARQHAEDLNGIIVAVTPSAVWGEPIVQIYMNDYHEQTAVFRATKVTLPLL